MENANEKPILVIGIERSGTTLLSKILNAHPQIQFLSTRTQLLRRIKNAPSLLDENQLDTLIAQTKEFLKDWEREISEEEIQKIKDYIQTKGSTIKNLQTAFIKTLLELPDDKRWGEKYDGFGGELDYFMDMFPDGQVILISRDLRDCYASAKMKAKTILRPGSFERGDHLLEFDDYRRMILNWNKFIKKYPKRNWLHIRYEELVSDPENVSRKICDFLNLEWNIDMINPEKFSHWGKHWTANTSFIDQKLNGIDKNIARHRDIITDEEMFLIEHYGNQFRFDDGIPTFFGDEPVIDAFEDFPLKKKKLGELEEKLNSIIETWKSARDY